MIFLYFISGSSSSNVMESEAFGSGGLQIVFRDCLDELVFAESKGPGGVPGVLVYALPITREKPFALRFREDQQEWIDCGTHWLGIQRDCGPSPDGLQRKKILESYQYYLADGREWYCPKIRRLDMPLVPAFWKVNKGTFRLEVKEQFVDVWEKSADWTNRAMPLPEVMENCALLLGLNYRVGLNEISAMNMLDNKAAHDVILAAIDEQFLIDLVNAQKKSEFPDSTLAESGN